MLQRFFKYLIYFLLFLLLLFIGFTVYLSWRPLSLNSFIGTGNNSIEWQGGKLEFSKLELYFVRGYRIRVENARFSTPLISKPADLKDLHIALDSSALLLGKLKPRNIIARGLSINCELNADGLVIAGMPIVSTTEKTQSSDLITSLNDLHQRKSIEWDMLAHLKSVHIDNADIVFYDRVRDERWSADNLDVQLKNKYGKSIEVSLQLVLHRANDLLPINFHFQHKAGQTAALMDAQVDVPNLKLLNGYVPKSLARMLDSAATIKVSTELISNNNLSPVQFKVNCRSGLIHLPDVFGEDLPFDNINFNGAYRFDGGGALRIASLIFTDNSAFTVNAKGAIISLSDNPQLALSVTGSPTTIAQISKYLPKVAAPELSAWLGNNLREATISGIAFQTNGPIADFPFLRKSNDTSFIAEFDFQNLNVAYFDKMPIGEKLSGKFLMERGQITIGTEGGNIDKQQLSQVVVNIGDVLDEEVRTMLSVDGIVKGETEHLLQLLSNAFSDGSQPYAIKGQHEAKVNVTLPLIADIKSEDISFSVTGNVQQASFIIPEYEAQLVSSSTTVEASEKKVIVKGQGQLNNRPATFNLSFNPVNKNDQLDLKLDAELGKDLLDKLLPQNYLTADGATQTSFKLTRKDKSQYNFELIADLEKTSAQLPLFSWTKSAGTPGKLSSLGAFSKSKKTLSLDKLAITAPALNINGQAFIPLDNTRATKLLFSPFIIDSTDLRINYDQGKINVVGNSLDYKAINLPKSEGYDQEYPDFDLTTDIQTVSFKGGDFYQFRCKTLRQNKRWQNFTLSSLTSEKDKVAAVLVSLGDKSELRLNVDVAGDFLRALSIIDNINGGKGTVTFAFPKGKELKMEELSGSVLVTDARFTKSPVLLKILSWFSLQQWLDSRDGVLFEKVSFNFNHIKPSLEIQDINFTGSLITIFGSGNIDTVTNTLDLKGNAVSLQMVGRLAENVPLLGGIVSNVQKGLMGITFTVKGPIDNPDVSFFNLPF
ncbi:MAG: AsmA-like C-terminal domain-containing protein [Deltaproteobacteria bacterium]|nr:AsmA-like C-terminal domain-containing protein [Deltaproteobacteria bacterium]